MYVQVSSYGGNLRYTITYQHGAGATFTNQEPDILLIVSVFVMV